MNKIICVLSNFITQYLPFTLIQNSYRPLLAKTLIIFVCILAALPVWADSAEDSWPAPVYFPQKQNTPQTSPSPNSETKGAKKWFWPFGAKSKDGSPTADASTPNLKASPKDPPPSPFPLIRIPLPFQANGSQIPAGIYLLKPSVSAAENAATKPQSANFTLTQRNSVRLQFQAHPVTLPDPNLAIEGTPSPLSKTDPQKQDPMQARVKIAPDNHSITLQILQAGQVLESEAFPTHLDPRNVLTY